MLRSVVNKLARAWLALVAAGARLRGKGAYPLLRLHITGELAEDSSRSRLRSYLGSHADDYTALLSLLRYASQDAELKAVLISIDRLGAGWARLQGLRRALLAVRAAGKQVWIYLTHASLHEYFLACAADRVILAPAGVLDIAGLSAETTFFFGALERLGIRAEVVQVGQYKSAGEPFTRDTMSPAHREMVETLIDDLYVQIGESVAEGRGFQPEEARALLGRGPFVAREALAAKLVDRVAYLDELESELKDAYAVAHFADRAQYASYSGRELRRQVFRSRHKSIAMLNVLGPIKGGETVPGSTASGSDTLCRELDGLEHRDDVAAVVVRINSPGGSGLASDLIWRSVKRLRRIKPVVVSMGDVAASGGYYIAAAAAPVIAEAGTITGSIGVIAGKATLRGLYSHLGISKEIVSRGEHASIHSDYIPLGTAERQRLESEARAFYQDFVYKVAEGRGLDAAVVETVAEGRVWTGKQALERGLVDQLGGLDDAVGEAKVLAGIPRNAVVRLERLPRPRRHWGLALLQRLPLAATLESVFLRFATSARERVWALMPFDLRFF